MRLVTGLVYVAILELDYQILAVHDTWEGAIKAVCEQGVAFLEEAGALHPGMDWEYVRDYYEPNTTAVFLNGPADYLGS